ncbi:IS3 family transposase [Allobacillus salarius]|uniref:IS3 family transposase n=1 Tax=Allobacillus salarius TaxID=1955272 RepID=A0A556PA44_9BACI|nr:IS3 family transposase [Allobacillus salarius]
MYYRRVFSSQEEMDMALFDYVHWFNNIRIHGITIVPHLVSYLGKY